MILLITVQKNQWFRLSVLDENIFSHGKIFTWKEVDWEMENNCSLGLTNVFTMSAALSDNEAQNKVRELSQSYLMSKISKWLVV